jgi:dipeptidase D
MDFSTLSPQPVWRHFQTLCAIPRASKAEAPLRQALNDWARSRGLATRVDTAGNLLISKPASAGREKHPGVILQGHLDMVCQQNEGSAHDFARDAIAATLKDGWLVAENTTLGADNGIGVALALAALEADDLAHPPLEVLLTVDEEAGMGGAQGLEPGLLRGRHLINLDTEEWGQLYVGCAGGIDVNVSYATASEPLPAGWTTARLTVSGLCGGHSGVDIHCGRGNAIKLLIRALRELPDGGLWRLASLSGGNARNALPREAAALIAVAPGQLGAIEQAIAVSAATLASEFNLVEKHLALRLGEAKTAAATMLTAANQRTLLAALNAAPHGVKAMSHKLPGVVETSNNFGVLAMADNVVRANFMVRSLTDSAALALAREIADLFALIGADSATSDGYPGWTPAASSPLLALTQRVYAREFGADAALQVIHAGLECGIIGAKYPGIEMISFGPTIAGAHAPGERVEVASVGRCWQLLTALLAALPAS